MKKALLYILLTFWLVSAMAFDAHAEAGQWYYDHLSDEDKAIYDAIYDAYRDDGFLYNNVSQDNIYCDEVFGEYYTKVPFVYESKNTTMDFIGPFWAATSHMEDRIKNIVQNIRDDHPELFWLSRGDCTIINTEDNYDVFPSSERPDRYDMIVHHVYVKYLDYFHDEKMTVEGKKALKVLKEKVDAMLPKNPTRYEVVKAIHDVTAEQIVYGYPYPSNLFWNRSIYSSLVDMDGDGIIEGVCENYSRLFKAICNLFDIPCMYVQGVAIQGDKQDNHMWNYVQMENSYWYAVDVTWDDRASGIVTYFLLNGSETKNIVSGNPDCLFRESHVLDLDRHKILPELHKIGFDAKKDTGTYLFRDVYTTSYFKTAVKYMIDRKIMNGTSDTTFAPTKPLTRGQVVVMLWNLEGQPSVKTSGSFSDVAASKYYAKAVEWAKSKKVVNGRKDGTFGPNDNISRQDYISIMRNYAGLKGMDISVTDQTAYSVCTDYKIVSGYAVSAVCWGYNHGLIGAGKDKKLSPLNQITRGDAAVVLQRFLVHFKL